MFELRGKIDENDLEYARKRFPGIIVGEPCPIGKGGKINPHVSRFYNRYGKKFSVFHVKPVYYETWDGKWRPLYEVAYYYGNKNGIVFHENALEKVHSRYIAWLIKRNEILKGKGIFIGIPHPSHKIGSLRYPLIQLATVTTVYPDPNPETVSVDGTIHGGSADNDWETARDNTGNGAADDSSATSVEACGATGGEGGAPENDFLVKRAFFLFDTSSITDTDNIDSAILSLYVNTVDDRHNDAQSYTNITTTNPASNTALVAGDFDQVKGTDGNFPLTADTAIQKQSTDQDNSTITTGQYTDWTLNATGLANISKTSVSKFGAANGHDIEDTPTPTGNNSQTFIGISWADQTGTSQDPKLAVTHSDPTISISVFDAISLTESATPDLTSFINVNDAISITESVTMEFIFTINVFDAISLTESITITNTDLGGINVNDSITITEGVTVTNTNLGGISVSDSITITESVTMELNSFINVNDSISLSESATTEGNSFISVNDSITITESVTVDPDDPRRGFVKMRSNQQNYPIPMDDSRVL